MEDLKSQIDFNKVLFWILLLYLVYMVKRGWDKSKTQVYSENAGSDLSTQQAIQLRQAFNPTGSSFMMSFDGTDTASIMETARQIKSFADVSKAYRALYGDDLTSDLTDELSREDLAQFWTITNAGTSTTTTTGGTTTTTKPATTTTTTTTAKTVTATTTANIRADIASYAVEKNGFGQNKQAKKGDVLGTYITEKTIPDVPNKGNRNVFVQYEEGVFVPYFGWKLYGVKHWIVKSAVSIK